MDVCDELLAEGLASPFERDDLLDLVLKRQLERAEAADSIPAEQADIEFHDRSPICTLALSRFMGKPDDPNLSHRSSQAIFPTTHVSWSNYLLGNTIVDWQFGFSVGQVSHPPHIFSRKTKETTTTMTTTTTSPSLPTIQQQQQATGDENLSVLTDERTSSYTSSYYVVAVK